MLDTRYSYNVDLEHPTTSQSQAVLLVTPGSTVLDVGAADGSVARPLAARGCRVWAIELDAAAAAKARSSCERVIVGDVEQLDLEAALEGQRFDFVLLLDVLEHLRDPLALLERLRDRVAPGGRVIASIPNVTHGAVRLSLMSGAFTYTETGLLDRTHLRFFDRRGAENLFADARLRIVERLRVTRELTETEIPIDPSQFAPSVIQKLNEDPDATTYQFLLVGKPSEGEHIPEGVSLAERLQRKADTLATQYRELEGYARSLEQQHRAEVDELNRVVAHGKAVEEELVRIRTDLDALGIDPTKVGEVVQRACAQAEDLRSELERRMREIMQQHLELRHLQADLAAKEAFITELHQANQRAAVVKEAAVAQESERAQDAERQMADLRQQLSNSQGDLVRTQEALGLELRHLQADLAAKEAFITELHQANQRAAVVKEAAVAQESERAQDAERQMADLRQQLSISQGDLARTQEALGQLQVLMNSAGFRLVSKVTRSLGKSPRTYKMLRGVVRSVAGKPHE